MIHVFREHGWEPLDVETKLKELQEKGLIKAMDHGAFTRVVHEDTQVQVIYYYLIKYNFLTIDFFCNLHVSTL